MVELDARSRAYRRLLHEGLGSVALWRIFRCARNRYRARGLRLPPRGSWRLDASRTLSQLYSCTTRPRASAVNSEREAITRHVVGHMMVFIALIFRLCIPTAFRLIWQPPRVFSRMSNSQVSSA